jgi:hypothetical protein
VNEINSGNFYFTFSPNPFHETTTLSWGSAGNMNKSLKGLEMRIYNSLGELVRVEQISPEKYVLLIERKTLPAGVYYFVTCTEGAEQIIRGKFMIE